MTHELFVDRIDKLYFILLLHIIYIRYHVARMISYCTHVWHDKILYFDTTVKTIR